MYGIARLIETLTKKKPKNKKRVSEAVSAQTYSLQENRGGKKALLQS